MTLRLPAYVEVFLDMSMAASRRRRRIFLAKSVAAVLVWVTLLVLTGLWLAGVVCPWCPLDYPLPLE